MESAEENSGDVPSSLAEKYMQPLAMATAPFPFPFKQRPTTLNLSGSQTIFFSLVGTLTLVCAKLTRPGTLAVEGSFCLFWSNYLAQQH